MTNQEIQHLLREAQELGFESIEEFVEANLHRLPKWKQELFHMLRVNLKLEAIRSE